MPDNPVIGVPTTTLPPVGSGGDSGGGKVARGFVAIPDTRQLTSGYYDSPPPVVDWYTPPATNGHAAAQVGTQINISATGWVLIGLVLLFLLKK